MATFFPQWLAPPSQMEERRMALMEDEVRTKSVQMLRRTIGMQKIKSETERLTKAGMDPETARRNAFLDNADLLFSDNPEAVAKIMDTSAAQQVRMQAAQQLQSYRENLMDLKQQAEARLSERDRSLDEFRNNKLLSDQENLLLRAERDQIKNQMDISFKQKGLEIQSAELELSKAREKRSARRENTQRQVTQKEIEGIDKQLSDETASMLMSAEEKQALKARRDALFKSLGDEDEEGAPAPLDPGVEEPPAGAGPKKRLKWNKQSNRIE